MNNPAPDKAKTPSKATHRSGSITRTPRRKIPNGSSQAEEFDSIQQLADRWGVCSRTVRREITRGELIAHWVAGRIRISRANSYAYLTKRRF